MKRFNVVRAKKVEGREKPIWLPVGTIVQFDNVNQILEMNDRNEVYQIFEQKDKHITGGENIPF
jgi:hypothetical protein